MQTLFVSWLLAPDYEGTRAGHRVKPYSALSAAGAAASSPKVGVWRPLIRPSKRPDPPRAILDLFPLSSTPAPPRAQAIAPRGNPADHLPQENNPSPSVEAPKDLESDINGFYSQQTTVGSTYVTAC